VSAACGRSGSTPTFSLLGHVLASAVQRFDRAITTAVALFAEGALPGGKNVRFDLRRDGVGLVGISDAVPEDVRDAARARGRDQVGRAPSSRAAWRSREMIHDISNRRLFLGAGAFAIALVFAGAVGVLAAPDGRDALSDLAHASAIRQGSDWFDWPAAIDAAVAFGTLGLAVGTFRLASSTSATVLLQRKAHELETQPMLVAMPLNLQSDKKTGGSYIIVNVVNVGRGPARDITLKLIQTDGGIERWAGELPALAANDRFDFSDQPIYLTTADTGVRRPFHLTGTYWNADLTTMFKLLPGI
jgi:hypothetical protein